MTVFKTFFVFLLISIVLSKMSSQDVHALMQSSKNAIRTGSPDDVAQLVETSTIVGAKQVGNLVEWGEEFAANGRGARYRSVADQATQYGILKVVDLMQEQINNMLPAGKKRPTNLAERNVSGASMIESAFQGRIQTPEPRKMVEKESEDVSQRKGEFDDIYKYFSDFSHT